MSLKFAIDPFTASEWRDSCGLFENYNLYQTWDYAEIHSPSTPSRGVLRCVASRGGKPVVIGQFRIKKIPLIGAGVAELEWGPLWHVGKQQDGLEEIEFFFREAKHEICSRRKLELRVYLDTTYPHELDDSLNKTLNRLGFDLALSETRNYDTVILNLSKDLPDLRRGLHQKWRNLLKKAENSVMIVESGRDIQFFDRFVRLYDAMRKVKDFPTGVRIPHIREMQGTLPSTEKFLISIAVENGRDIGATVCAMTGQRMLYLLGATDPEHRGNAPGYLLQWKNIQFGKENGMKWYDLGGLVSEGVSRFKVRMGGEQVAFPRRMIAQPDFIHSTLFHLAEKGFDWVRR